MSNGVRKSCQSCRNRPPSQEGFGAPSPRSLDTPRRGTVLCFECYRAEVNRRRTERPEAVPSALPIPPFFSEARKLTSAEVVHRRQMLGYLRRSGGL